MGDTFSRKLEKGQNDQSHAKTIFSQPALIEAQKAAEDLKKLNDVALPAGEAKKVSQCYSTKCGVLMSKPVLDAPNFQKPYQLAADASDVGVDAVLLQMEDMGFLKPMSYFSKKLNPYQRRHSTIEKECLGLVLPVQHFDVYLSNSSEVTVSTDHNPLTFLECFRNENQRLFRRSSFLQPYGLKVTHFKGKDNIIANTLSRA